MGQMYDFSENLQERARLWHDRNVEAVSSLGVRSPYRPGVTSGTTGQALRQIERQRCPEMGPAGRRFSLEPCACCPAAHKSFVCGSANGNRTDRLPVQSSSPESKCLQTRPSGLARMLWNALRIRDVCHSVVTRRRKTCAEEQNRQFEQFPRFACR